MKVVCLSTDPGISYGATKGAAVHLAELAGALASEGADVLLLVAEAEAGVPPPPGTAVETIPGCQKGMPAAARLDADGTVAAWLEDRLSRFGATVLYERLALHTAAGSRSARSLGLPHLLEVNAPLSEEAATYRRLDEPTAARQLEREVVGGADMVFPVSSALDDYVSRLGARRVDVLPNAVTLDRFPPRPSPDLPAGVVLAGRLRPWHGAETVAEAWTRLGDAAPPLLVVGDGDGRDALTRAGAEVTGPVPHEQVPRLLARAGIGLVPYAADAPPYFSPLKLFEYLAAGLAVVAVPIPGVIDIVGRHTAVLVPPGDAAALADAVAHLAADPVDRAVRGSAGRALVEAGHTWSHRARRVLAVAHSLAGARA